MSQVKRFDRGELKKPQRLANGWLKVDGYVGRTGLLEYTRADGTKWVEYRPPEEAFHADVLDSFSMVPLTNDHPPGGLLDAENTKVFQAGTVERPTQDGEHIRAKILVTDEHAIADIEAGKAELSMGYMCELDLTPGVHEGKHYDCVQRNVRGNHVALVNNARGGPTVRLRVDSNDSEAVSSPKQVPGHAQTRNTNVIKIKIDGVEVEVSETAAQLIAKSAKADADARAAVQVALEKATARADAADADVKRLSAELKDAPAKARAAVESRAKLESVATKILGEDVKFDGLTDLEVKRLAGAHNGVKLDGKPEAYVEAMFDIAVEKLDSEPGVLTAPAGPATAPVKTDAADDSLEAHEKRHAERMRNAYKLDSK